MITWASTHALEACGFIAAVGLATLALWILLVHVRRGSLDSVVQELRDKVGADENTGDLWNFPYVPEPETELTLEQRLDALVHTARTEVDKFQEWRREEARRWEQMTEEFTLGMKALAG